MMGFKHFFTFFMFLRIVTFNVRGLLDTKKFEKVKEMCKENDMILLQETNWKESVMVDIRRRWDGDILYNNGVEKQGRGIAFLIKRNSGIKCKTIFKDKEGKCMMVEMEYEGKIILIVNVHAPTEENEKGEFFKMLKEFLNKYKEIIMMGDFNTVFNKLDMAEGMVFKTDKGRKELKGLMEKYDIIDVWRERNENTKEYTRRQLVGDFMRKTRIDLILCTRNIEGFIGNIKFEETSFSDHKMISMAMDWNQMKRGPGVWVLNTEILREENYVSQVKEIIEKEKENRLYTEDKRIWWENVKYLIKKFTIKYCARIQKCKRSKEKEIRKELKEQLEGNRSNIQKIKELEGALKEIEEKKYEGARLRSKAKYMVEGEKCTKFFFDLEKTRGRAGMIKGIKRRNGEIITTSEGILREIKGYFEELFSAEGVKEEEKLELLELIKTTVQSRGKKDCDEEIRVEEIKRAISELNRNKSPGIDGLGNEFYIVLKDFLSSILKELYEEIFREGELDQRMGMGLMKIIYKRRGEKTELKNYRPITMLNADLKILSKVLSNRLKEVMPGIIKTNQAYGVQGRDIADTTFSIKDSLRYINEKGKDGFLISLDFEKAFDRVEHSFLFDILRKFGFGDNFIKWITIMYKGATTKVKCNGFLTPCFKITRSIRQGCPLSALLYSLVAEPLGLAIKQDKRIKGIEIEGEENKIFQYADDTTLMLKGVEDVKRVMQIVQKFCLASGAKVNEEKTIYMRLGKVGGLTEHFNFKETKETKILGVIMGEDERKAEGTMWENILGEIERRLLFWRRMGLTIKGKVLILNVLMVSKLWYILYTSSMPMWMEGKLKKCFLDFLWEGKPPRIAFNTILGQVDKGGLGLIDVEQRKNSLRVKMIKKYLDDGNNVDWKRTMGYFINKCSHFNLGDNILWMRTRNWMMEGIPEFYKEMMRAWGKILTNVHYNLQGRESILNQPLFLNNHILNQGKEILFKKWWEVGITKVRDILYEFKEGFLPEQFIVDAMQEAKEDFNRQEIRNKYEILKTAIPKEWIKKIENMEEEKEEKDIYVRMGENLYGLKECTIKNFYCFFRDAVFKKPIANEYWSKILNDVEEKQIWGNINGKLVQAKLEELEFFIRHKVVFTDVILSKIGMEENAICKVCKDGDENFLHLFFNCNQLEDFKNKCENLILSLRGERNDTFERLRVFMLGIEKKCKNKECINLLVILMKSAIWERRLIAKKENHVIDVWYVFKRKFEKYVKCLFHYFKSEENLDVFYKTFTEGVLKVLKDMGLEISF